MKRNLDQIIKNNELEVSTDTINTPERVAMRNSIILDMLHQGSFSNSKLNTGEVAKLKRLDIVIGLPGSGKSSTVANPLSQQHKSLIIDSDFAKELLPEYNNGLGANRVHKESKKIAQEAIHLALERNINIVYSIVGKSMDSITEIATKAKSLGYNVHLNLVDIEPSRAAIRAMERYAQTGRYIDAEYILKDVDYKPKENFERLKNHTLFSTSSHYNNNVAFGQKPILVEKINNKGIASLIEEATKKLQDAKIKLPGQTKTSYEKTR